MRIPSRIYVNQQHNVSHSKDAQKGEQGNSKAAGQVASSDVQVTVSARAKELAAEGAIDVQKVERLKAAIQDGSFQIDPQRIAERIVDQE